MNGYFDVRKNRESDWSSIRDNAKYQDIDVLGEYSHLTWRISDFKKYDTEITKPLKIWIVWCIWRKSLWGLSNMTGCSTTGCTFVLTIRRVARMRQIIARFIMPVITMRNRSVNLTIFLLVVGGLRMRSVIATRHVRG